MNSRAFKGQWSEIDQTPAPRQPFAGNARRFEIDVVDAGLGQLIAEVFGAGALHGADSQEEDFNLLVERVRVREHAII